MSRIGSKIIEIPSDLEVSVDKNNFVTAKGAKGELTQKIHPDIKVIIEDGQIKLERPTDQKRHKAIHGLCNSLISNLIVGVSQGYTRELELYGVGYRASNRGNLLELSLGYSHPIYFYVPDEIKLETVTEKGKPPTIVLSGQDKQLIGQVAAKVRAFRKPEPYKGKGIRFKNEQIRRKAGKTAT